MPLCQGLRRSKSFSVFVCWISLVVSYTLYTAIVPILPFYVEEFIGNETDSVNGTKNLNTSTSTTTKGCPQQNNTAHQGRSSRIIGALLGTSKAGQLVASPFVGVIIDKIGYDIPLFMGYAIQIGVALGFTVIPGEALLFVMRCIQGIGSALINTTTLTIVADLYKDDDQTRGKMISYAMTGLTVGCMVGPTFGSVLYQFGREMAPFLVLAVMTFCVAVTQAWIRIPRINPIHGNAREVSPLKTQLLLLKDPYVDICLLLTVLGLTGVGFLNATLPYHMLLTMCPEKWMLGVVFVPLNIGVCVGIPFQSWMTRRFGRWFVATYSYILTAGPYIAYPFCRNFVELLLPGFPLGVTVSARAAAVLPSLAYLVHSRYGPSAYGGAYALADMSIALSLGAGPLLGGVLEPVMGFKGLMFLAAALSFVAVVPLAFLRKLLVEVKSDEQRPFLSHNEMYNRSP